MATKDWTNGYHEGYYAGYLAAKAAGVPQDDPRRSAKLLIAFQDEAEAALASFLVGNSSQK